MKESQMVVPNHLGHYHRDIVDAVILDGYYMLIEMSCGHMKEMSRASYKKYSTSATLCTECTNRGKINGD